MMIRASEPPINWRRSRLITPVRSVLGIAPPFTQLVLSVIVAPEFALADYIINVMLHETRVNIKNVRLHKKCRLAPRNAVAPVAFWGGPSRIFHRQAKQPRRPLRTLNAEQGTHIYVRLKMCGAPSKRPGLSLLRKMVEGPVSVCAKRNARPRGAIHCRF